MKTAFVRLNNKILNDYKHSPFYMMRTVVNDMEKSKPIGVYRVLGYMYYTTYNSNCEGKI